MKLTPLETSSCLPVVQKTIRDSTYIILLVWDVVRHRDIYFPKESTPQWEPDTSDQVASTHKCEEVARSLQHQSVPSKAESQPLRHQSIEVIAADQSLRIKMIERRKKTNKVALFAGKISRSKSLQGASFGCCPIIHLIDWRQKIYCAAMPGTRSINVYYNAQIQRITVWLVTGTARYSTVSIMKQQPYTTSCHNL
jgi:hypothetical protein